MTLRDYQKRMLVPLLAVGLGAYYVMVFLPVKHRAESLDAPLRHAWRKLTSALDQTNAVAVDFQRVTNQLGDTRDAIAALENARQKALLRIDLPARVRSKLNSPFELVDYQNERSKDIDDLFRLAKEKKVALNTEVYLEYPEHTADMRQPALLWPALYFTDSLVRCALQRGATSLLSLDVPITLTNFVISGGEQLVEIPIEIEFVAPVEHAESLLRALPLRGDEAKAAGFADAPPDKPALFLDRVMLRKQSPEKPDEARVFLRAVGYVLQGDRASQ